jgi:DNA-binding phage protein
MKDLKKDLKAAILQKYGTIEKWANANDVLSSRFYNFLKGSYNPTLKTLESWLQSVDLELATSKRKKS